MVRINLPWTAAMIPWGLLVAIVIGTYVVDEPSRDMIATGRVPPLFLIGFPIMTGLVMLLAAPATASLYNSTL